MVFYFRSWHWSCCWLLLLIACCWVCWMIAGCCWDTAAAAAAAADCCWWLLRGYWLWMIAGRGWDTTCWLAAGEKVFEFLFRRGDEGIWQRQVLKLSWNNFDERQLEFDKDIIQKFLRIFSMRSNWNLAKILFKNVLEHFRWEEIGI